MNTGLNTAGYNLYEVTSNEWIFDDSYGPFYTGTFKQVATYMCRIGFELDEIQNAAMDMISTENNAAHFGMYKSFTFSFQKNFNDSKVG